MANMLIRLVARILARPSEPSDDQGAVLVEYVLLLVFIVVLCALAVTAIGQTINSTYSSSGSGFG